VVVHIKAASLNYRDLLTRGDVAGIRQGLVPLSDAAGTVVAVGRDVTRWQLGDRVSPAFFPTWLAGQFSTAHLAHALGGGGTDGVLAALRQVGGRHGQHGLRPTRTQGRGIVPAAATVSLPARGFHSPAGARIVGGTGFTPSRAREAPTTASEKG